MSIVGSLPSRELTDIEIKALNDADATDTCDAIAGRLTDDETIAPPDAVVGVRVTTDTQAHLLAYDAATTEWITVDSCPRAERDSDGATTHIFNWLEQRYDTADLVIL